MIDRQVIVIGGGAAGMMAAGRAAELGARVTLLEKMERPGKKVLISGNARCNLSNSRSIDEFIPMYGKNGRFLHRAFRLFFRDDLLQLLASHGVMTAVEEDGRIFPESGKSAYVVRALTEYMAEKGVTVMTDAGVLGIERQQGGTFSVHTATAEYEGNDVILSPGGASYPQTGSTGDGFRLAERLGHSIVPLRPALAPLIVRNRAQISKLQGVSLQNVRATLFACEAANIDLSLVPSTDAGRGIPGKIARPPVVESQRGDLIFTHYGLSGPAILLMSLAAADVLNGGPVSISIDMAPNSNIKQLNSELRRLIVKFGSRHIRTILSDMLPARVADVLLRGAGIDPDKDANQVSAEEREKLVNTIKNFSLNIKGTRPLAEALVTAGGVSLSEVNPQTMESRLIKGLYFCGEILDIDADTGGFNLQAAFSTGYLAGESAALSN